MNQAELFTLCGQPVSLYALLAALLALCAAASLPFFFRRRRLPGRAAAVYVPAALLLGLLLGRSLYCAVRTDLFLDPLGRSLGAAPFFNLGLGSLSVVGLLAGVLLAALPAARLNRVSAAAVLDAAAVPGLLLFAALRFIEPISGQGYGPLTDLPLFCRVPLGIRNGWGEWSLSVCFLEGVILLVTALCLWKTETKAAGSLALYALVLLSACQIVPESLRRDGALRVFVFARVTQIGYAVILLGSASAAWIRGARRGLDRKVILAEASAVLLGILLLIGGEFALDRTDWPEVLIYAGMLLVLFLISLPVLRRIRTEDRRAGEAIR